jgi:hypothetical protein
MLSILIDNLLEGIKIRRENSVGQTDILSVSSEKVPSPPIQARNYPA